VGNKTNAQVELLNLAAREKKKASHQKVYYLTGVRPNNNPNGGMTYIALNKRRQAMHVAASTNKSNVYKFNM
jgi:hypothetical protein